MKINNVNINIKLGDITKEETDAIVNAANSTLLGGGGVDGAIHKAGGKSILKQCIVHSGCPTGEARITTGGNLPSKYVIHAVGPIYKKENKDLQDKLLFNAYYNTLKLAGEYNLNTISFPSISTGAYGFPIKEAVSIVLEGIKEYSSNQTSIKTINLILHNEYDYNIYLDYFNNFM